MYLLTFWGLGSDFGSDAEDCDCGGRVAPRLEAGLEGLQEEHTIVEYTNYDSVI